MDLIRRYLKIMMCLLFFVPFVFEVAEGADSGKNNTTVSLSYKSKFHGNFNVEKFKLNHPIKISRTEIIHHLISLRFKGTFLGNKEEPIFSKSEIKNLAPVLMKAFARVSPDKIIHIELKGESGITSGDIFSFRKFLNWRFDFIRGESFFQRNDVREWNVFAWKLIPQEGQLYFKTGVKKGKRIQRNWIVSKLNLPRPDRNSTDSVKSPVDFETDSSNHEINPKLEKKLKHLKYLHDNKLIGEEEYKAQQKILFDELF